MNKFTHPRRRGPARARPSPPARAGRSPAARAAARPDRNADVTRQQVIERTDQRFARLDANNDGRCDRRRGPARPASSAAAERAGRMFERLDADRDGSVSRAEFDAGPGPASGAARRTRRARAAPAGMRRHAHRGHGGPGGRHARPSAMFGEQGFVTREQMRERALARFDRSDANRDGTLTAAERQQAREQFRQHAAGTARPDRAERTRLRSGRGGRKAALSSCDLTISTVAPRGLDLV